MDSMKRDCGGLYKKREHSISASCALFLTKDKFYLIKKINKTKVKCIFRSLFSIHGSWQQSDAKPCKLLYCAALFSSLLHNRACAIIDDASYHKHSSSTRLSHSYSCKKCTGALFAIGALCSIALAGFGGVFGMVLVIPIYYHSHQLVIV